MKPVVSIIMAVYNAEPFLEESLQCLLTQTYGNIEIIAIDDCSTDCSLKTLEKYADKDSRLKIVRQKKNMGPGPARNVGLDLAIGEYIAFLDPDDLFTEDAIEKLATAALIHQSDVVKGVTYKMNSQGKKPKKYSKFIPSELIVNTNLLECRALWLSTEFWTYLYSSKLLKKHRFLPLKLGEDFLFILQVLADAKRLTLLPDKIHFYRQNPFSLTQRKSDLSICNDAVVGFEKLVTFLRDNSLNELLEVRLVYQAEQLMGPLTAVVKDYPLDECFDTLNALHKALCRSSARVAKEGQSVAFQYCWLLLEKGFCQDAYSFLKRFNGKYNRRSRARVFYTFAWDVFKYRFKSKLGIGKVIGMPK